VGIRGIRKEMAKVGLKKVQYNLSDKKKLNEGFFYWHFKKNEFICSISKL